MARGVIDFDGLEPSHQSCAVMPRDIRAGHKDVVSPKGGQRNACDVGQPDPFGEIAIFRFDLAESRLGVAHQVHLINGKGYVADSNQ